MAPGGSRPHHSSRQNLPPTSASLSAGPALSRKPTPALAPLPAPIPTSILAPATTNELFKKFLKAYLETNQGSR